MVVGIGVDIVKVAKFQAAIEKWGQDFIDRVFHKDEIKNIPQGKIYYQRLSARFAAKEAVIKAISKNKHLALKDICILNREMVRHIVN